MKTRSFKKFCRRAPTIYFSELATEVSADQSSGGPFLVFEQHHLHHYETICLQNQSTSVSLCFVCVLFFWLEVLEGGYKSYNHYLPHGQLIIRARPDDDQDKSDKREGYNWLKNCTRVEGEGKNEEVASESSATPGGRRPNRGSFAGGILTPLLLPRSCSLG